MSSTEGNRLPEGWEIKSLADIGNIFSGNSINAKLKEEKYEKTQGTPYVATKDISYNSVINYDNGINIPLDDVNKFRLAKKETIFICAEGGSAGRKVGLLNQDVYFVNKLFALETNSDINSKFCFYWYLSNEFKSNFKDKLKGLIGGVSKTDFKKLPIPIPPLYEQKRIVAKIDGLFTKIDKAITLTEESLKQAKNLLSSVLNEVFEKGKADGWEEKKLEEVCDVIGGGTPKTKISEYWDGEIVWLSPIDLPPIGEISIVSDSRKKITDIGLKKSSAKLLPKGSVVYSTRASIGKIAIAEIPLSTNQGFTNFICGEGLNNRYLCFCLKHFNKTIENLSNSTTFKEVSKSAVKEFEIPVPSIDSQMKVVKIADDVLLKSKQTQSKLEEQLAYLKQLKSSILSKAFKGEL